MRIFNRIRVHTPDKVTKWMDLFKKTKTYDALHGFLKEYWLLCFFIILIAYFELLYRLWIFKNLNLDYLFPFIFAFSAGTAIYLLINLLPERTIGIAAILVTFLLSIGYGIQLIYTCIFQTPLSLISLGGAGDALQFQDIIIEAIIKNFPAVIMLFVPLILTLIKKNRFAFTAKKPKTLVFILLFCIASYSLGIICVNLTDDSPSSQYTLYYKASSPELSANKLGILTTMRLDLGRIIDTRMKGNAIDMAHTERNSGEDDSANVPDSSTVVTDAPNPNDPDSIALPDTEDKSPAEELPETGEANEETAAAAPIKPYNVMDIDFETLLASGEADSDYAMHKYFSTVQPTATNQYTGMFKDHNLIMLTAEGFSPYVISPELTPTLYQMANEGFVFNNFYNPVWWVSTSDGEYVACTGLIPKSGVWSMAYSGKNYMPFAMGNQFKKLGYITKAYHNHTYTYYKRNISHPNLGYDYKGVGNGLNVKKTWPESDLEMIDVTAGEYIGQQPFHAYYMTVSGHMNYSFGGNQMARKNKEYVEDLPYSDTSKAYIACNLELEFALASLVEKLEEAGVAENTVIALSADHYPYGLPKENIDELAGHEVEKNFELYKSTFILWKKGMEPIIVDKPCASLDIIPTLSNLFGLEYDSRLLMGSDILSDAPTLVIFSNRSWITDRASYNSADNKVTFYDGTTDDKEYVKTINRIVADKFTYSTKILETDYYKKVIP